MENSPMFAHHKIGKALNQNDPIVVQVTKDPMQSKGARLTIRSPGRMMVLHAAEQPLRYQPAPAEA